MDSSNISSFCIVEQVGAVGNIIYMNAICALCAHTLCVNCIIYIHGIGLVVPIHLGSLLVHQPCLPVCLKTLEEINECLSAEF